jgi:dihydropteroate synthase
MSLTSWLSDPRRRTLVMGILNVTPDSFSDGGQFLPPALAIDRARQLADEGADWIDIGFESTRPGSQRTPAGVQLERLRPVFAEVRRSVSSILSIDTTRAQVAEAALDAGADVVNDISAGLDDPAMFPLVSSRRVPVILMHMLGQPATMQADPRYTDVTREVADSLRQRLSAATDAGINAENILLDPGIGFGKTLEHNLQLLRDLPVIAKIGRPVVVGVSRKGFLSKVTSEPAESGRPMGTAGAVAWSVAHGASVIRVHDVARMSAIVKMVEAIARSDPNS